MVWNCGGLAAAGLDELKLWLTPQRVPLAILLETHWPFSNTWSDDWHCIHSGKGSSRSGGVAILISKDLCRADDLRWNEIEP